MYMAWAAIIGGTVLVGGGGLAATWGWNHLSKISQQAEAMEAAVREWKLNDKVIESANEYALGMAHKSDDQAEQFEPRPLNSFGLQRALTTVQSDPSGEEYEAEIAAFNRRLQVVGRLYAGLFVRSDFIHDPKPDWDRVESHLLSDKFLKLRGAHRKWGEQLQIAMPHAFDE